jgi:adenine-specific DNA-methyltransferase
MVLWRFVMNKLDDKINCAVPENVSKMKKLFPEIFCEGKIDFAKLRKILGEYIDDNEEKYIFSWNGKGEAIRISQEPSSCTLISAMDESKNWDTTENLYIEGDNLEALKLLQKDYNSRIKMIYIDPPYNTGNDFVYHDDYGRYHTDWLNMMYPRLKLARNLLSTKGVIFISIDDCEFADLRKICDEIFGDTNFIGTAVRRRRKSQANLSKNISPIHEYVLIYSRCECEVLNKIHENIDETKYKNPDGDPRGPYVTMPCTNKGGAKYSIKTPAGNVIFEEWRFKKETYEKLLQDDRIVFPRNGEGKPRYKLFLSEKKKNGVIPNTWWDKISSNQEATREIKNLFNGEVIFDTPKPVELIKFILKLGSDKDSIILDFFGGSSTTAHAVMQLNAEDNGNRKYIMVQIPEPTYEKSKANKAGYKNICEIGKERIRLAGDKIVKENEGKVGINNLDIGFKVFKLESLK